MTEKPVKAKRKLLSQLEASDSKKSKSSHLRKKDNNLPKIGKNKVDNQSTSTEVQTYAKGKIVKFTKGKNTSTESSSNLRSKQHRSTQQRVTKGQTRSRSKRTSKSKDIEKLHENNNNAGIVSNQQLQIMSKNFKPIIQTRQMKAKQDSNQTTIQNKVSDELEI